MLSRVDKFAGHVVHEHCEETQTLQGVISERYVQTSQDTWSKTDDYHHRLFVVHSQVFARPKNEQAD
jgi:hypothetical protein